MTLALHGRTAAARQARRILRTHIARAAKKVKGADASDADIHTARKRIKNARAVLGLLRRALRGAAYRSADQSLRDAARPLSVSRDAKILVEAFDALSQRYRAVARIPGVQRFRRALMQSRARARRQVAGGAAGTAHSRKLLQRAAAAARRWPLGSHGWGGLVRGASHCYTQGRATLQELRREPTVEQLHRWRKQAKRLCYQLELLAPVCAPTVARMAAQLRTLSDELGADHDLAVLRAAVAAHAADFAGEGGVGALTSLIERARRTLQRSALRRGAQVYRPTPARFARLLEE